MITQKSFKKQQQGYTLAEILIGVVVAAILAATTAAGYRMFSTSHTATTLANSISQTMNNISQAYSNSSNGFGSIAGADDMKALITQGVFLPPFKTDGTKVTLNGLDVTLKVGPVTGTGTESTSFTLLVPLAPASTCASVLKTLGPGSLIAVGDATTHWAINGGSWLSATQINTLCSSGTSTGAPGVGFSGQ